MAEEYVYPPPPLVNTFRFRGDRFTFSAETGMLSWHMREGSGFYIVNNPQRWDFLPPENILEMVRQDDRKRLQGWIAKHDAEQAERDAQAVAERIARSVADVIAIASRGVKPDVPKPKPRAKGTDYERLARQIDWAADRRAETERASQEWAKRKNKELRTELRGLLGRMQENEREARSRLTLGAATAILVDDHHYIEAMFALYSQQRYRLL
jgi:hypothetical protein